MISIDDSNEDPKTSEAANELMNVYDSCRELNADFSAGRRMSSICSDDDEYKSSLPPHPENWPQRPLLLRPTPGAGMKIRGVRYSSSKTYLASYEEGQSLPINNGLETKGRCLVIDFESDLFIGTALLRLKNARRLDCDRNDGDGSNKDPKSTYYFHMKKRTFQTVIRGRFKRRVPMSECVTGQMFTRPAGVLPPRLIVKAAVLLMSHLAPQLQSRLEGECPRFLSPLCSTAQTAYIIKKKNQTTDADEDLEDEMQEPHPSAQSSFIQLLPQTNTKNHPMSLDSDIKARIKRRKKLFDKLHSSGSVEPSFCTQSEYCFEFFQHLILFDKFTLDFPKPVGQHSLKKMLNGQPLQILALHQERKKSEIRKIVNEELARLWSFDIWHESVYEDAIDNDIDIANSADSQ
mmetsp:Transcript_15075/g.30717  ORF Transcript_15075/g.30717 Transcript_15075/m.30717 type:complete len:405 (-) Transcript_15075:151-1365(-)|eukprot:scaffold10413_cov191-Skeletonema_marinoi.AAC.8